jgi:8-hydroxy-5-deazaflavin:NADPH oxidoreductase
MTIAIIGSGHMSKALSALYAASGEHVVIGSRNPGNGVQSIADAAAAADIVLLAVPYHAAAETIAAANGFKGKILVDMTNPLKPDFSGITIGFSTSAAEEIAKLAPEAQVVKGFNTIFASILANGGKVAGQPVTVFLAGDDAEAVAQVEAVTARAGCKVIKSGPLANARHLEALGMLNIALGYHLGHGTDIAPTFVGL